MFLKAFKIFNEIVNIPHGKSCFRIIWGRMERSTDILRHLVPLEQYPIKFQKTFWNFFKKLFEIFEDDKKGYLKNYNCEVIWNTIFHISVCLSRWFKCFFLSKCFSKYLRKLRNFKKNVGSIIPFSQKNSSSLYLLKQYLRFFFSFAARFSYIACVNVCKILFHKAMHLNFKSLGEIWKKK